MAGDGCPYDHGKEPVVMKLPNKANYLENSKLLSVVGISSSKNIPLIAENITENGYCIFNFFILIFKNTIRKYRPSLRCRQIDNCHYCLHRLLPH